MNVNSIAEQLFFTTTRIDTVTDAGGHGSGTGFLFSYKQGQQSFPFVVTNKHVVQGMKSGALSFLQKGGDQPRLGSGSRLEINGWSEAWFGHPSSDVDIAICPFAPLEAHRSEERRVGKECRSRWSPYH